MLLTKFEMISTDSNAKKDYKACLLVAKQLSNIKDLPQECFDYKDIVANFQRRPTKSENSIAFEGMGNAGAAAASARMKGQQNYAQVQRRFTNTRRFTKEKWRYWKGRTIEEKFRTASGAIHEAHIALETSIICMYYMTNTVYLLFTPIPSKFW
jgi:hypothetical protein